MVSQTKELAATKQKAIIAIQIELAQLAAKWRNPNASAQTQKQIEDHYLTKLDQRHALGFSEPLDVDAELPDRLLPDEYLALRR